VGARGGAEPLYRHAGPDRALGRSSAGSAGGSPTPRRTDRRRRLSRRRLRPFPPAGRSRGSLAPPRSRADSAAAQRGAPRWARAGRRQYHVDRPTRRPLRSRRGRRRVHPQAESAPRRSGADRRRGVRASRDRGISGHYARGRGRRRVFGRPPAGRPSSRHRQFHNLRASRCRSRIGKARHRRARQRDADDRRSGSLERRRRRCRSR